jgi:hypothetical protein
MKDPKRSDLILALERAFAGFVRVFADTTAPLQLRLHCWRQSNAIIDLIYGAIPRNGRSRARSS